MMGDLRFALRVFRKTPALTLVAVLSLALGIGANTAIYSWMDGLVLHPLPLVQDPSHLVLLQTRGPGGAERYVSYPDFVDWKAQVRSVAKLSAYSIDQFGLRTTGQAERAWGVLASADYFDLLGVRPMLGRFFRPDEAAAPASAPVAVLGYGFWQRKFAGDSGVIGRHLLLNGRDVTVVGVAPAKFGGAIVGLSFDVWVPITMQPVLAASGDFLHARGIRWLTVLGRLKPGASVVEARADVGLVQRRLAEIYGEDRSTTAVAARFSTFAQQQIGPLILALLGITAVVLLVACANVANLLLARATARQKEMALRLALGAGRRRLVRQLLVESGLLAGCGGAVGLFLAAWARELFTVFVPPTPLPIELHFGVNIRVLVFAVLATGLAAVVFGAAPALRATRPNLVPALKDAAGQGIASRSRLRSALVAGQLALSVVALVAAGLFLRSLSRAGAVDRGLRDPAHVLLAGTNLFAAGYSRETGRPFVDRLLARVRTMPGVRSASVTGFVPLGFPMRSTWSTEVEGYQPSRDEDMLIQYSVVGSDYFETMGTSIVRGRGITAQDRDSAPQVAVVNETFARRYWPGLDPIGRRLRLAGRGWSAVVGVARDGKYNRLGEPPQPFLFLPFAQVYTPQPQLVVRAAGDPHALIEPLREVFASLDPNVAFLDPRTLAEHMEPATYVQQTGAAMFVLFGALALVMAAVGIYGVTAYLVSQRTREIGIRVALGAARRDIVGLIVGQSVRLLSAGLLAGVVAALGVGVLLRRLLFGVRAYDAPTFVVVLIILAAVALLASWLPARRAAQVDPVVALKYE
jgi:macrolide transport system ATP-binding/permease protein